MIKVIQSIIYKYKIDLDYIMALKKRIALLEGILIDKQNKLDKLILELEKINVK